MSGREVLEEALAEAAPYLANPEWARRKLEEVWGETLNLTQLLDSLSKLVSLEGEPTRKTDLKILLQYLERQLGKSKS
ncbi:MAG: hypothetical protein ACXQTV_04025 [Candidatus Hecatellaceae archaeon]